MAWYDENEDWAVDAVRKTLTAIDGDKEPVYKKANTEVQMSSAATLLGMAGAGLYAASMSAKKDAEYKKQYGNAVAKILNESNRKLGEVSADHYTQIENLSKDLKVMFTPFTAVYMLRNTVVDAINVDKMTSAQKSAWRNKDHTYFKNLLVNKVYLDAQASEQMFIRKLIDSESGLRAGTFSTKTAATHDVGIVEMLEKMAMLSSIFQASSTSPLMDKYAATVVDAVVTNAVEEVLDFDLGAFKMAADEDYDIGTEKLAIFGIGNNANTITPKDISKGVKVVFLPDRVLYIVDNIVITQTNTYDMSEEDYSKFVKRDGKYFKSKVVSMSKTASSELTKEAADLNLADGTQEIPAHVVDVVTPAPVLEPEQSILDEYKVGMADEEELDKIAELSESLFIEENIDPKVYYLWLTRQFGTDWFSWDVETMSSMIADLTGIVVNGIVADKLAFLVMILNSNSPYTGYHTFEKIIRSFNNRDIDFDLRESNIELHEFVWGLRTMSAVASAVDDNIYDNMSEHVFGYMLEVLVDSNCRCICPQYQSKTEEVFWKLLASEVHDQWNKALPNGLFNKSKLGPVENSIISRVVAAVVDKYRGLDLDADVVDLADNAMEDIRTILKSANSPEQAIVDIVAANVATNLGVDSYCKHMLATRTEQIKTYLG